MAIVCPPSLSKVSGAGGSRGGGWSLPGGGGGGPGGGVCVGPRGVVVGPHCGEWGGV